MPLKDLRIWIELLKMIVSFLTVLTPFLEKWQSVLPINPQIRQQCLLIAVFVCFLAVIAGYSTGRHTAGGLSVGWCFLLLFLSLLCVQLANFPKTAWVERPLYVLLFAFFSLSTSAFLAYGARKGSISIESWEQHSMR